MSSNKSKKNIDRHEGTTIRFDPQIKSALQHIADAEDRSLANMIERIVKEYLRKKGLLNCGNDRKESPRKMLMTEVSSRMDEARKIR